MSRTPTCGECRVEMVPAKGYHAILAFRPPEGIDPEQFSPVFLYVCRVCREVRFYLATPTASSRPKSELVSYGYRIRGAGR